MICRGVLGVICESWAGGYAMSESLEKLIYMRHASVYT